MIRSQESPIFLSLPLLTEERYEKRRIDDIKTDFFLRNDRFYCEVTGGEGPILPVLYFPTFPIWIDSPTLRGLLSASLSLLFLLFSRSGQLSAASGGELLQPSLPCISLPPPLSSLLSLEEELGGGELRSVKEWRRIGHSGKKEEGNKERGRNSRQDVKRRGHVANEDEKEKIEGKPLLLLSIPYACTHLSLYPHFS